MHVIEDKNKRSKKLLIFHFPIKRGNIISSMLGVGKFKQINIKMIWKSDWLGRRGNTSSPYPTSPTSLLQPRSFRSFWGLL